MRTAFTLIELLVAIAVIAVLAAAVTVGLMQSAGCGHGDESQITVNNLATGIVKIKVDLNLHHRPLAACGGGFATADRPTLAELRTHAAQINLAVELCPKKCIHALVIGDCAGGRWPWSNARLRSHTLANDQLASYEFGTYFDPSSRQLASNSAGVPMIVDPWLQPYRYLVFMELQDQVQTDGVTVKQRPVYYEVIASAGPDGQLDATMTNYSSTGGFTDTAAHLENEDNIYVEVGRWSPQW